MDASRSPRPLRLGADVLVEHSRAAARPTHGAATHLQSRLQRTSSPSCASPSWQFLKGTAAYPAWRAEAGGTISARSAAVNQKMDILTRGYVASREYQVG